MTETLLDTNVLLYAISTADEESDKKLTARGLMANKNWGTAVQVLQEFYVNATRANKPAMSHPEAEAAIRQFLSRPVAESNTALLLDAMQIKQRYQLSYWDAAVIAAAKQLGASILYSEDLNDGQVYDGVQVVNPFKK